MVRDDGVDDPVATAVLSESSYERLRVRRHSLFSQSIPRKLAFQGTICLALALVFPIAMTLPASTQALFANGDPLTASPKILLLGAYAGALELVAAAGLCYVAYRRVRQCDSFSEREAHHLLTVEDVASMVSLVTGAVAVAVVDGFFLIGHDGGLLAAFLGAGGGNPYAGTPIPVTVTGIAVTAAVLGVALFALSGLFARRLPA